MNHEERAVWIRRGIILFIAAIIVAGVWFYPKKQVAPTHTAGEEVKYDLEIIHYHQPQNAESEQIAESLKKIETKYNGQVKVTRVDINAHPEQAKAEKVTKPPKVVMMAGSVRACKFQGVWTQVQIERKVEEILRGLKRVGKDWRPDVQGMQPSAAGALPPPASKPQTPPSP